MGNDGGSIPKRSELVRPPARIPTASEAKATALESLQHSWTHCRLTDTPLAPGATLLASDSLGRLYSYEAVLAALAATPPSADAAALCLRSVRDLVRLHPAAAPAAATPAWVCQLTRNPLGPATRAVYVVPCGHVFADAALRESRDPACPECATPCADPDAVVPILPTAPLDLARLAARIERLRARGLSHSLRKDRTAAAAGKKRRRKQDDTPDCAPPEPDKRLSGINNEFAASLTAKVLAEQDELNKRRRLLR